MYRVYEDFMMKKIIKEVKTRKEAQTIKKQFPKHSEVWIEKVEEKKA